MPSSRSILLACLGLMTILTVDAWSYIDPGSGSYVFQILIAGIFAGFGFIVAFWQKIKNFFSSLFKKSN